MLRLHYILYKRFENLMCKLRHAVVELSVGRGLCAPCDRTVAVHLKRVALGKNCGIYAVFRDW